ncbi:hypothetical protein VQ02_19425 [Methylobacterium variabile]|jgi:hypothetical protein|uniref:DUF7831 domain-containing protein n=1 Tax=Methylobacterium variabile TaxID=298794 RepID=A0A0J6SG64_9HYPH|nr:hypothetical protein VQ02_19425 [Methylobacterium variabile]
MPIRREQHITRQMLRNEPDTLWVFGDNLLQRGLGGHARESRGEPNAVGIPTKRLPTLQRGSYFADSDADLEAFLTAAEWPLRRLEDHLRSGGAVVWPAAGIGTGQADLERKAPRIWASLERARKRLEAL